MGNTEDTSEIAWLGAIQPLVYVGLSKMDKGRRLLDWLWLLDGHHLLGRLILTGYALTMFTTRDALLVAVTIFLQAA